MVKKHLTAALGMVLAFSAVPVLAQEQPGQGGSPPAGGRPDMTQMRQRMEDRIKEVMGASDDEWKVLQPRIEKVQQLQRATSGGRSTMRLLFGQDFRNRGGDQPRADAPPPTPVEEKSKELETALENKDAKPEDLKAKLAALREARAKAKAELTKAQDDLRGLLTARQESVLVMLGMLE